MSSSLFSVYGRATPDHESGPILIVADSAAQAAHLGNLVYGEQNDIRPRCYETLRVVEMFVPESHGPVFAMDEELLFHVNPDGNVDPKSSPVAA
jgi:hypothetical protein